MSSASSSPRLSVVIPVHNEAGNVLALLAELRVALKGHAFEAVFVDDGSTDETAALLLAVLDGRTRLIRHARRSGKSAATLSGVRAARGEWIATLDGDGQNDPADLPALLGQALREGGPDLVGGLRLRRRDPWTRRVATGIGNGVRRAVLRDNCADTACGLKVFRRQAFLDLPFFDAMHRFLPALFQMRGARTEFVAVNHRPRRWGVSHYGNLSRGAVGAFDLLGVVWLRRRTTLPDAVREEEPAAKGRTVA